MVNYFSTVDYGIHNDYRVVGIGKEQRKKKKVLRKQQKQSRKNNRKK